MTPKELIYKLEYAISLDDWRHTLALDSELDQFFGIIPQKIDTNNVDAYPELEQAALSTSYLDYYKMLKSLKQTDIMVDLGAGYCRGTLLATYLELPVCISVEFVPERIKQATHSLKSLKGKSSHLVQADLAQAKLPCGTHYFLYFPLNETLLLVLRQLFENHSKAELIVCESHGDLIHFLDTLNPWLRGEDFISCSLPRHSKLFKKYELMSSTTSIKIEDSLTKWWILNFDRDKWIELEYFHKILNKTVSLIVTLEDLEIIQLYDKFYLQNIHSGRVFNTDQEFKIKRIFSQNDLSSVFKETMNGVLDKKDKILITPELMLESSSGKLVHTPISDIFCQTFINNQVISID